MAKIIQWAAREKRRAVNEAVGRDFFKTLTEPLTNADSIMKKQAGVRHSAGLVDEVMKLRIGDRVNTAEMKARLKKGEPRKIRVEIITSGRKNRIVRVIDTGTGMSCAELEEKFSTYGSAKAKGERTRSLFGRGALDVLIYHRDSIIYSVKNGVLSSCPIYWTKGKDSDTAIDPKQLGRATKAMLQTDNLPVQILHHGTVVQFSLTAS